MRNHGKSKGRNSDWGGGCRGKGRQGRDASERSRRIYRVEGRERGCLGDGGSRTWWGADDEDRVRIRIRIREGLLVWDRN